MAKTKRNIGQEILDGIRQIKRGQHGRITNVWTVRGSTRSRGAHRLICFRRDYQLTIGAERRRRASNDWFSDNEYGPRP